MTQNHPEIMMSQGIRASYEPAPTKLPFKQFVISDSSVALLHQNNDAKAETK